MIVRCRTNLDNVMGAEQWPTELPERPVVGDHIRSLVKHGVFQLELEVFCCTWVAIPWLASGAAGSRWILEVELGMPSWQRPHMSIAEWQEWYRKARGLA